MESGGEYCRDPSSANACPLTSLRVLFQIIEGIASGSLNVITGLMAATLSTWPRAAIPAGILVGNTIVIACLISATGAVTGAHINPMVTMAIVFSGLCHPVRAIIYIFCQLVGGAIGGSLLRVTLGKKFAHEIHNAGCWIDPNGEVSVWQAASTEFTCTFILLSVTFFYRLDTPVNRISSQVLGLRSWIGSPSSQTFWRKIWASARRIHGRCNVSRRSLGHDPPPDHVGLPIPGLIHYRTSITSTIHVGYTGAAMFPGRCFGLAVGIGEFQTSHWVSAPSLTSHSLGAGMLTPDVV